jgi:hypothetical protein
MTQSPLYNYNVQMQMAPPPQQQRMMTVSIPLNIEPGQRIQVRTPEGQSIDVIIPQGVHGGEQVLIPY